MGVIQKVTYERLKDGFRRLGEKNLRLTELSAQPLYEEATEFGYVEARRTENGLLLDRLLEMEGVPREEVHSGEIFSQSIYPLLLRRIIQRINKATPRAIV